MDAATRAVTIEMPAREKARNGRQRRRTDADRMRAEVVGCLIGKVAVTLNLYCEIVKPVADRAAAFVGLVILSPVFLLISTVIRIQMGSPVIFRQKRIGLRERPFNFVKFRTMTDKRDIQGCLRPDGERLTRLGVFLRSTSLDELPQLWNILRGEMSLIGPRPLLPEYLPRYSEFQRRRHEVRPGITGWAQVNGRNACSWKEKFEFDVWYVDHCGPAMDLRIITRTLIAVVRRQGISQAGQATSEPFLGSSDEHAG